MREKVKDFELRKAFIVKNKNLLTSGEFINEYNINRATIDLCMLNNDFYAYEIKSEADNLKRLPNQLLCYELIADFITLVVWENHLEGALKIIENDNIGVIKASKKNNKIVFKIIRKAKRNIPETEFYLLNLFTDDLKTLAKEKGLVKTKKELGTYKYGIVEKIRDKCKLKDVKNVLRDRFNKTYVTNCPACGSPLTYNTSEILDTNLDGYYKRIRRNFYIGCFDCGEKTFKTTYDTFSKLNKKEQKIYEEKYGAY